MLIGLTKVRNEEHIIKDTLDNWSLCDKIYVYDDRSEDDTVKICEKHPKVAKVIKGKKWDEDRERAEWQNRQRVLLEAQKEAGKDDWFAYFDADEHLYDFYVDFKWMDEHGIGAIVCKLFDIYITPGDINRHYKAREWIGPEYRLIPFFFKNHPDLKYEFPDQRIINLPPTRFHHEGAIKHFSKGFSVEHWEKTCDYYIQHWPKYAEKWKLRKGKAVHTLSDFNNLLISWEDRDQGFLLQE